MSSEIVVHGYSVVPYCRQALATDDNSKGFNEWIYSLKDSRKLQTADDKWHSAGNFFASLIHQNVASWFSNAVLVPLPRSTVSLADRAGETNVRFARAIAERFATCTVYEGLRRISAVPKANRAASADRPTIDVYVPSLTAVRPAPTGNVLLIDDVCTKGNNIVAATKVLRAAGAAGSIRAVVAAHSRLSNDPVVPHLEFEVRWVPGASDAGFIRGLIHPDDR